MQYRAREFVVVGVAMLCILVVYSACKPARVVEKPLGTVPTAPAAATGPVAPHPEAGANLPPVERKGASAMAVYRHTNPAFASSYGYDTAILRIWTLPDGQIATATLLQRTTSGETEIARYNVTQSGKRLLLAAAGPGEAAWKAEIVRDGASVLVSGARSFIVSHDKDLVFASVSGDYRETYSADASSQERRAQIIKGGQVLEMGECAGTGKGLFQYAQHKPDDTQNVEGFEITIWVEDNGDLRWRTEGPEPVNEVYLAGAKTLFGGEQALINVAILDLILGESRYLRPVYACALAQILAGK